MSTHRTPPQLLKGKLNTSSSEPDLFSNTLCDIENVSSRGKRPRMDESANSQYNQPSTTVVFEDIKKELMQMLSSWKIEHDQTIASWRAEQTSTLNRLVNDMTDLRKQMQQYSKTISEIEKGMEFINESYECMKTKIVSLEREKSVSLDRISMLEKQIQDIQTISRPTSVEIRNVPLFEKNNETHNALASIVQSIGKTVDMEVQTSDLRDIYRVPTRPGVSTSPSAIVAYFIF
ncbi:hypothetical protein JYU34_000370 [Plutella xylostella]|uniref:Uncharacterized protein n=1 Tax=Plutella xylostella TaxID=51655 RepID=A0ABQ7R7J0_PLUXY|nr:hypothetical protein JYU34_000370 [Plutella xylostella]